MHTLHWIAVKAESKQEAFDTVSLSLLPSDEDIVLLIGLIGMWLVEAAGVKPHMKIHRT